MISDCQKNLRLKKSPKRWLICWRKVLAKVTAKNPKSIIFDIGGKSEGVVAEKAFIEARDFVRTLKIGGTIESQT